MKKIKYFIPSFIIMMIIFSFSMQTGEESGGLSLKVVQIIQEIFPFFTNTDLLHTIIRKGAHMSEYAVLTLTYVYGFYKNNLDIKKICLYSILCTFLYASTDELHQLFVGGRAGQLTDVLIDTTGGLIIIIIVYLILRRKTNELSN